MPPPAIAARMSELLERLRPLGGKRRGMRIEADDWNALVDAVRGVLEVAASGAGEPAPQGPHAHLGEIGLDWLGPDLQARIAAAGPVGGGGGSIDGRLDRLRSELGRLRQSLEDQVARVDRTVADSVDRLATLRDLERRLGTVADLPPRLGRLDERLRGIAASVQQVDEFRRSLLDAGGQPIDVGRLRDDVFELRRLRDSLEGPDGRLLRVSDLAARLAELSAGGGAGGGGEIGPVIDERLDGLRDQLVDRFEERLATRLGEAQAATEARVGELRADVAARVEDLVGRASADMAAEADARFGRLGEQVRTDLATGVQSALGTLRSEVSGIAAAQVDGRLSDLTARVQAEVAAAQGPVLEQLRTELVGQLSSQLEAGVGEALTDIEGRLGGLDSRVAAVDAMVDGAVDDAVRAQLSSLTADVDARVEARLGEARLALQTSVDQAVVQAVGGAVGDLEGRVGAVVDARLADVDGLVGSRIDAALSGLPETVRAEVVSQVEAVNVSGQIEALRGELVRGFQGELSVLATRIDADRSAAINEAIGAVRRDLEVTRASTLAEATRLIDANRVQLENRLSSEISTTRLDLTNMVNRIPIVPIHR